MCLPIFVQSYRSNYDASANFEGVRIQNSGTFQYSRPQEEYHQKEIDIYSSSENKSINIPKPTQPQMIFLRLLYLVSYLTPCHSYQFKPLQNTSVTSKWNNIVNKLQKTRFEHDITCFTTELNMKLNFLNSSCTALRISMGKQSQECQTSFYKNPWRITWISHGL